MGYYSVGHEQQEEHKHGAEHRFAPGMGSVWGAPLRIREDSSGASEGNDDRQRESNHGRLRRSRKSKYFVNPRTSVVPSNKTAQLGARFLSAYAADGRPSQRFSARADPSYERCRRKWVRSCPTVGTRRFNVG